MGLLDPTARRVVGAAALLGRRFDWELLPGIADVDGRAVVDALRAAVDAQIVAVDDGRRGASSSATRSPARPCWATCCRPSGGGWRAGRGPRSSGRNPGLPGATCELAAELAEAAGAPARPRQRLVESARRALAAGALATAEGTARRARRLAPPDEAVARDADETLVRVLVAAGKPVEARELGHALLPRLAAADRADLLVGLAHAALAAGDLAAAERDVAAARSPARRDPGRASMRSPPRWRWTGAPRRGHAARPQAALAAAEQADQPEVQCEALEVIGRAERGPERCTGRAGDGSSGPPRSPSGTG